MKKKYYDMTQSIGIDHWYWRQYFFNSVLVLVIAILLRLDIGIDYYNTIY